MRVCRVSVAAALQPEPLPEPLQAHTQTHTCLRFPDTRKRTDCARLSAARRPDSPGAPWLPAARPAPPAACGGRAGARVSVWPRTAKTLMPCSLDIHATCGSLHPRSTKLCATQPLPGHMCTVWTPAILTVPPPFPPPPPASLFPHLVVVHEQGVGHHDERHTRSQRLKDGARACERKSVCVSVCLCLRLCVYVWMCVSVATQEV